MCILVLSFLLHQKSNRGIFLPFSFLRPVLHPAIKQNYIYKFDKKHDYNFFKKKLLFYVKKKL